MWSMLVAVLLFVKVDGGSNRTLSEQCARHWRRLLQGKDNATWAKLMFDANGKFESGLQHGNSVFEGDYQQCLSVVEERNDTSDAHDVTIHGQYCVKFIYEEQNPSDGRGQAMCIPHTCTREDAEIILSQNDLFKAFPDALKNQTNLRCIQKDEPFDTFTKLAIAFIGCSCLLVAVATVLDIVLHQKSKRSCHGSLEESGKTQELVEFTSDKSALYEKMMLESALKQSELAYLENSCANQFGHVIFPNVFGAANCAGLLDSKTKMLLSSYHHNEAGSVSDLDTKGKLEKYYQQQEEDFYTKLPPSYYSAAANNYVPMVFGGDGWSTYDHDKLLLQYVSALNGDDHKASSYTLSEKAPEYTAYAVETHNPKPDSSNKPKLRRNNSSLFDFETEAAPEYAAVVIEDEKCVQVNQSPKKRKSSLFPDDDDEPMENDVNENLKQEAVRNSNRHRHLVMRSNSNTSSSSGMGSETSSLFTIEEDEAADNCESSEKVNMRIGSSSGSDDEVFVSSDYHSNEDSEETSSLVHSNEQSTANNNNTVINENCSKLLSDDEESCVDSERDERSDLHLTRINLEPQDEAEKTNSNLDTGNNSGSRLVFNRMKSLEESFELNSYSEDGVFPTRSRNQSAESNGTGRLIENLKNDEKENSEKMKQRFSASKRTRMCNLFERFQMFYNNIPYFNRGWYLGKTKDLILAFSLYTNFGKLFSMRHERGSYECLHGIRFLSFLCILFHHVWIVGTMVSPSPNISNHKYVDEMFSHYANKITAVFQMYNSVDAFFVLSSMLATISFMRAMDKQCKQTSIKQVLLYYINRYIRLTPMLGVTILLFLTLVKYYVEGPMFFDDEFDKCKQYWWTNLLYIHTLLPNPGEKSCFVVTWYLGTDFQLFLISPLFIIPLYKYRLAGKIVLAVGFGTSLTLNFLFYAIYVYKRSANDWTEYWNLVYMRPWTRATTYFIGIFLGYIIFINKGKVQLKKGMVLVGWTTAICGLFMVGYIVAIEKLDKYLIFLGLENSIMGVAVAWTIFACVYGYGGMINKFLSWKIWIPLGRLAYAGYLIHPMSIKILMFGAPKQIHIYPLLLVYFFLGHLMITLAASVIFFLMFEIPMISISRTILPKL